MLEAFLYGLTSGIAMCLSLGTVFFALIQNSVDNGYRSGMKIAFGVVVCDLIFIFFALFGTTLLPPVDHFDVYLRLSCAALLLTLGTASLLRGTPKLAYPQTRFGNFLYYFGKGFLLNALNPINFFIWVSVAALIRRYDGPQTALFFGACLLAIFGTETGISLSAHKLKHYFSPRVLGWVNKASGLVFILVGLNLAWSQLRNWW
jgi:L-lysine exporter family protein LysE/ArgO